MKSLRAEAEKSWWDIVINLKTAIDAEGLVSKAEFSIFDFTKTSHFESIENLVKSASLLVNSAASQGDEDDSKAKGDEFGHFL